MWFFILSCFLMKWAVLVKSICACSGFLPFFIYDLFSWENIFGLFILIVSWYRRKWSKKCNCKKHSSCCLQFFSYGMQAEHNLYIYKLFIYYLPHNLPLFYCTGKIILLFQFMKHLQFLSTDAVTYSFHTISLQIVTKWLLIRNGVANRMK